MLKGTSEIQTHPTYGTTIKCFAEGDGRFFSFGVVKARKVLANLEDIIRMVEEADGELTGIEVVRNA
jgi:hypothetical protein